MDEARLVIEIKEEGQPGAPGALPTGPGALSAEDIQAAGTPGGPPAPPPFVPPARAGATGTPASSHDWRIPGIPEVLPVGKLFPGDPGWSPVAEARRAFNEESRDRERQRQINEERRQFDPAFDRRLRRRESEEERRSFLEGPGRFFDAGRSALQAGGSFASGIARGDNAGASMFMLQKSASVAAAGLEKLGPVGMSAGAALRIATEAVGTFAGVVQSFVERGKQLAPFSSELTSSNVMADLRSFMDDLKEAEVLGPSLARLTDAQSDFNHEMREAMLPIKQALIEDLIPLIKNLGTILVPVAQGAGWLAQRGADVVKGWEMIFAVVEGWFSGRTQEEVFEKIDEIAGRNIDRAAEDAARRKRMEKMLDLQTFMLDKQFLFDNGGNNGGRIFGVPEPRDAPAGPAGPPLFPGL